MLLKTEGREVDPSTKNARLRQDTDASDPIQLHLHVWVTVGIAQVREVWSPGRVLGVALYDYGILV